MNDARKKPRTIELQVRRRLLHCGIWLSTYGLPRECVVALQRGLTATADRCFAGLD